MGFTGGIQFCLIRADHPGVMTTTSFIILNAALAAAVVAGILRLLIHGIRTDGLTDGYAVESPTAVDADVRDRLAA
jgi:hypothetical protein